MTQAGPNPFGASRGEEIQRAYQTAFVPLRLQTALCKVMGGPMRRLIPLLAAVWVALVALPALAQPVRLIVPQAGAALAAGSTAELEWAPLAPFDHLSKVEEWEAFLSVDGGATYPLRITPHLDQDLRRIRFQVPAIPTADARILLRFGDERRETAVALPERFSIVAPPDLLPALDPVFGLARRAVAAGEPALPGQTGVVAWVEGSRRGGELRQVVASRQPGLEGRFDPPSGFQEIAVLVSGPAPPQPPGPLPGSGVDAGPPAGRLAALWPAGTGPPLSLDILLLIQRQNE
jgi:hypothetical protein